MNTHLAPPRTRYVTRAMKRWLKFTIVTSSAFTFAGCVEYIPRPLRPNEEIRKLFERSRLSTGAEMSRVGEFSQEWLPLADSVDAKDGLSLAEINSVALNFSPELMALRMQERISEAQLLSAGRLSDPELFVGPRLTKTGQDLIFPASLSARIPLPAQLDAEVEQGTARRDLASWAVAAKELELLISIREKFILLHAAQAKQHAFAELNRLSAEVTKWAETLYSSGEIDPLSYHLARSAHGEIESLAREFQLNHERAVLEILTLAGIPPSTEIKLGGAEELPELEEDLENPASLIALPALKAAEESYKVTEAALRAEILRQYPQVSFGPEFESDKGSVSIGVGLGVTLPIWNRNSGPIKEAEESREAARISYESTLFDSYQKSLKARFDRRAAKELLTHLRSVTLPAAGPPDAAIGARLSGGIANVLEIITARRTLAEVRVREAELEAQFDVATLKLASASGQIVQSITNVQRGGGR
jgi:outer membrane protein, heavy metal efflux system